MHANRSKRIAQIKTNNKYDLLRSIRFFACSSSSSCRRLLFIISIFFSCGGKSNKNGNTQNIPKKKDGNTKYFASLCRLFKKLIAIKGHNPNALKIPISTVLICSVENKMAFMQYPGIFSKSNFHTNSRDNNMAYNTTCNKRSMEEEFDVCILSSSSSKCSISTYQRSALSYTS